MSNTLEQDRDQRLRDPITLAIAVILDRIRTLPKDDRDDMYELTKTLFAAETEEERQSAGDAMLEILEQSPMAVAPMGLPDDPQHSKTWVSFVSGRIREAREAAGMTQMELAEKAGLPQSHISRLENGKHSPSFATLEKIAVALNVPVSEFDPSA